MSHINESEVKCIFCSIYQKDNDEVHFLNLVDPSGTYQGVREEKYLRFNLTEMSKTDQREEF